MMADSISCPHCRRLLEVPEEQRGREVRCPECQKVFVGGAQTDITAQAPQPMAPPAAVQPGLSPAAAGAPWPESPATTDDEYDLRDRVAFKSEFRPAGGLGLAVKVLLGMNLLFSFVLLGSDYLQYQLALRLMARVEVPAAELNSNDDRQQALGFVHLAIYVVSAIVFVIWFYRAHANLEPLGARRLTYTSGWAAGCWFVPILNLFRPVQIAQEIWRNSDPDAVSGEDIRIETSGNSALVGSWWAMWIISNVISNISARMTWAVNSPHSLETATVAGMVSEVASIILALLALAVVSGIDARQTARAEALRARD